MIEFASKSRFVGLLATAITGSFVVMPAAAQATSFGSGTAYHQAAPVTVNNTYTVGINKTEIVKLPSPASAVIIGNPEIADVTIHSSDTIFVL